MKTRRSIVRFVCEELWFTFDVKLKTKHFELPIHVSPPHVWWYLINTPGQRIGRFKKHVKDAYNPRRWGGYILGLEIGSRG
jgi:hypothetical protein